MNSWIHNIKWNLLWLVHGWRNDKKLSRFNLKRSINQSATCHTIRILIWSFLTYFLKLPLFPYAYVICYVCSTSTEYILCFRFSIPDFLKYFFFFFSCEGKTLFLHFPTFRHYCLRAYWKRYASSFKFSYLDRRNTSLCLGKISPAGKPCVVSIVFLQTEDRFEYARSLMKNACVQGI